MKPHYLLLGILFCYTSVAAQIDRSQQPQPGPEPEINFGSPQEYRFSNGLTLLVVENHKLPQVSVSLRIDNPLYPEGDKAGINQLLSEMMGKGSKSIEKDAFEEEIDFMGAHFHFNLDGAHASSLTRYFPRVFEMLADATLHPNFVPEEFEKEKEKAIEGLKTAEKDVKTAARRVQNLLSYGAQHPYGEYTTEGSLQNSTLEDLMKQYQQIYHAKNAYLIVVGDINFKAAKKLAKKHFGRWKAGVIKTTAFPAPENVSETQIAFVEMPNAVQSEIAALFTSDLDKKNPDYYAALIANQILGGGGEARLFLNLREDKGFTYGAYSNLSGDHKTKARLRVATSVRNAVTDSAVVKLHYEIDRMSKELVTDEELDLVKNKYAGSLIRSLEDPENIANFTYNVKTQNLPVNFYNNLLKNIKKVTKKDILRASKKYLSAGQLRIVVTGKGSDILSPLEALKINEMLVKVSYFDKWGTATERPAFSKPIPEGTTAQSVIEGYLDALGEEPN
jgi:predicted Zn-dependent peptidase